jgi:hypothetical protein
MKKKVREIMSKNTMYVVVETIDRDYDDLQINYHSVCETACMAALNAKSAYERFISEHMLTYAPRWEELDTKSYGSEMRWTYVEKNEEINHYIKYSVYIKPYIPNTKFSFCDTLNELEELIF